MLKTYTAYTNEIDDVELAVAEILDQLSLNGKLLTNSVGIISCFPEYTESGVVTELCKKLPFDVAGTTSIASAVPGCIGETMLGLTVLTSDDCQFATGFSDEIISGNENTLVNAKNSLTKAYEKAAEKLPGKPALMLSFAPLIFDVSGSFFVKTFNEITGGLPNFGTLSVDHTDDYSQAYVIHNGESNARKYAFILIYGDITPNFYIGTISDERIFSEKAAVTASEGNLLKEINGMPATEYLFSLGLPKDENGNITGMNSMPLIVDYNDGTQPVARAMFALTPQGYVVCGADIPVGATISIGRFDVEDIKQTTRSVVEKAVAENKNRGFLVFSCIGRYFAQGINTLAETEVLHEIMENAKNPYIFAYSGGEICPLSGKNNTLSNREHNNTIVICAL